MVVRQKLETVGGGVTQRADGEEGVQQWGGGKSERGAIVGGGGVNSEGVFNL